MKLTAMLLATLLLLTACATPPASTQQAQLAAAQNALNSRDYTSAYDRATHVHSIARGTIRFEAAYVAGVSAQKLGNASAAESYLREASRVSDTQLAGDANASLGLLYSEQGRYDQAANALMRAAPGLTGEDKANAYFYAAVAQQKIGQWPQARTNLVLARATTQDPGLRTQIESQLAVTGYTIQVGAFRDPSNARSAADRLADKATNRQIGLPRLVSSTDSAGRPVTLVHVGRYSTFSAANRARQTLGDLQAIIVPLSR